MPFSRPQRGVFLGVIRFRLAFLATLVFLLVAACSGGSESESTSTAVADATQEPIPTAAIVPVEQPRTVDELLGSIERAVEEIRGIDTPPPVDHMFVDKAGMKEQLDGQLTDPEVLEQIEHEETLFKLLGVIPQDADLNAIYESLFSSQALGLYDPEKEEFFVLGDDQSGAESIDTEAQLTYAHEYVHRLQDAKFDLEAVDELSDNDDMALAISALIEGDATAVQSKYMLANYDFSELSELLESALADQAEQPDSPYFLQQSLEFAYTDGAAFIAVILQLGEFAAVDAVFANPPKSTEQVLHPEKYLDEEEPIELDIADDALGDEWSIQAENVMGEFFIRTWLEALGSDGAERAANGWGGDAYAVFERESSDTAFALMTAWDTNEDASQFMDELSVTFESSSNFTKSSGGLEGVLELWDGPGGSVMISRWDAGDGNERVSVTIASDSETAQRMIAGM